MVALINVLEQLRRQEATVVIVTHRSALVDCVDKVLVLKKGCIEHFGDGNRKSTRESQQSKDVIA
ncbi:hypothetical protein [Parendozoicomonas sp. Alg238-R29]|uniref:hypothetical protein n=1 Tax=Parendozoicomonas sp. Alg238-R29 TaxID=2993446 RepID=UPI00248E90BF|nr:hypothetical protein [Parendozoicomonas sp. Alg238-R29]